jgi:hypothetical protein
LKEALQNSIGQVISDIASFYAVALESPFDKILAIEEEIVGKGTAKQSRPT